MIETTELRYAGDPDAAVIVLRDPNPEVPPILISRDRAAEVAIHAHWHRRDVARFVPTAVSGLTVSAQVNDNRWLVQCPACQGAQIVSKADPRFFCIDCLNAHVQGSWLAVSWPDNPDEIEAALNARPVLHTRSWKPGEGVADLERENVAHGVA